MIISALRAELALPKILVPLIGVVPDLIELNWQEISSSASRIIYLS